MKRITEETTVGELFEALEKEKGFFVVTRKGEADDEGFTLLAGTGDFAHRFEQTGRMLDDEVGRNGGKTHGVSELTASEPKRKSTKKR